MISLESMASLVIAMLAALVSAVSLMRFGWVRRDWFPVFIGANLAWIAVIYILVLMRLMPQEEYPAWARPSAAFVFFSFTLLIWRKRL